MDTGIPIRYCERHPEVVIAWEYPAHGVLTYVRLDTPCLQCWAEEISPTRGSD